MSTFLVCAMAMGLLQPGSVSISAQISAEKLNVGATHRIVFDWKTDAGASVSEAGMPAPLIQIEVPKCVELVGEVLESHKALAKNEFLHAPFERALTSDSTTIDFKLLAKPRAGDQVAINFIAYAKSSDGTSEFIRKRIAIPVAPAAKGAEVEVGDAAWGKNSFAKIGEKVKPITLPRADGSQLDLGDWIGKSNIIITTYRAYW